ncbi:MAG: hypothetical protein Q7K35_01535 [bacterium]|nr:hypothetical protein [bacterium]
MRKNKKINCGIMAWPQEKAKYERLVVKIEKLDKKFNEQTNKIFEILDKLVKHEK